MLKSYRKLYLKGVLQQLDFSIERFKKGLKQLIRKIQKGINFSIERFKITEASNHYFIVFDII